VVKKGQGPVSRKLGIKEDWWIVKDETVSQPMVVEP
jgi:hypothetical protein